MATDKTGVAIIGGGISGLACGVFLRAAGEPVVVLESSQRAGGVIASHRDGGYLSEIGPNSTLDKRPALRDLIHHVRLDERVMEALPGARNRFVLRRGALCRAPLSPPTLLTTPLFSVRGRLRILAEPFVRRGGQPGETVSSFVIRRFGREMLDYALDPFVSGVYAGDPDCLELESAFPEMANFEREHGSVIRAAIHAARAKKKKPTAGVRGSTMISFAGGMQELTDAAADCLGDSLRLGATVRGVAQVGSGGWSVSTDQGAVSARRVIVSVPADVASRLVSPLAPDLAGQLGRVPYAPVAGVFVGYRADRVAHALDGFGFLVPSKEKRPILGTIFSSSLFPGRAPAGHVALTVFTGGVRRSHLARLGDEQLTATVCRELADLVGARGAPDEVRITRWERAIPQYVVGHRHLTAALEVFENSHRGIFFCANFVGGPSVVDCIHLAQSVCTRLIASS